MRAEFINYFEVLFELWKNACSILTDTETIAHIRGVAAQIAYFNFFFFGLVLVELLLDYANNLSRTSRILKYQQQKDKRWHQ